MKEEDRPAALEKKIENQYEAEKGFGSTVLIVAGERWDPATLMFDYSWCGLKKRVLQLAKKKGLFSLLPPIFE